jgi:hypothetical protein
MHEKPPEPPDPEDRTPPHGDPLRDEAVTQEDERPAPSKPTDSDPEAD